MATWGRRRLPVSITNPGGAQAYPISSSLAARPETITPTPRRPRAGEIHLWSLTQGQRTDRSSAMRRSPRRCRPGSRQLSRRYGRRQAGLDDGSSITLKPTAAPPVRRYRPCGDFFCAPAVQSRRHNRIRSAHDDRPPEPVGPPSAPGARSGAERADRCIRSVLTTLALTLPLLLLALVGELR